MLQWVQSKGTKEALEMNREQAHEILMNYMQGENYIKNSYAVEAIIRGLAKRLAPNEV